MSPESKRPQETYSLLTSATLWMAATAVSVCERVTAVRMMSNLHEGAELTERQVHLYDVGGPRSPREVLVDWLIAQ